MKKEHEIQIVTLSESQFNEEKEEKLERNQQMYQSKYNNMCDVDPLAQTFLCTTKGGAFITKVDLYFASKDNLLQYGLSYEML